MFTTFIFNLFVGLLPLVQAQSVTLPQPSAEELLQAVITGPRDIQVGKIALFDAELSTGLTPDTQIRWYLNDSKQPISQAQQAAYTPLESGQTVIRLEIRRPIEGIWQSSQAVFPITSFNRKIVLIADNSVPLYKITNHTQTAAEAGIYLKTLQLQSDGIANTNMQQRLVTLLRDEQASLTNAESFIIWTEGITGIQALLQASETQAAILDSIANKPIILFTNQGLQTIARTVRGPFSVLQPSQIIVTRKEAINPFLLQPDIQSFINTVQLNDIGLEVITKSSVRILPWNIVSSLVNFMLVRGVPSSTILLLLILPIIATILAFLKQVIGVTTLGLYTPSVIALGFITLGWEVGLPFILFIIATGYFTRSFMRRWRMMFFPKVAITISVVSFTLLLLMGIGAAFNLTLTEDKVFVLLIMSTLSESFFNLKIEAGWRGAFINVGETIAAALLAAFVVQLSAVESMILAYPELLIVTIVINIFLGQWTGLRLLEYFRFKDVFTHIQEE